MNRTFANRARPSLGRLLLETVLARVLGRTGEVIPTRTLQLQAKRKRIGVPSLHPCMNQVHVDQGTIM